MSALILGVLGATGRMGKLVVDAASGDADFSSVQAPISRNTPQEAFEGADVVIDFSNASATFSHLTCAQQFKKPLLIGTTGLDARAIKKIEEASKTIPVLWAPNTSWSMAIFKKAVELVAQHLTQGYDLELMEAHHRSKQDKPSGTALVLQDTLVKHASLSALPSIASLRGGQLPGEHTVHWMGDHDRVTLSHQAFDRSGFVKGALQAAKWLAIQPPGKYTIEDIFFLNLK
ncbi:MAG: 4-hydroxy-tetrahydrodipicolinate reductase [Alphaproteobacteria bacterium]